MVPASPGSGFYEVYTRLYPSAQKLKDTLETQIKKRIPDYFWPNEDPPKVEGRIKDRVGLQQKLTAKQVNLTSLESVLAVKSDFLGLRIVVTFREQIERAIQLIAGMTNVWRIEKVVAYTNDSEEAAFYKGIGLDVESRATGYCGVHFDIFFTENEKDQPKWVEVQIRTKIQDAWQGIDHMLYKTEGLLSPEFVTLRKSLAGQFEAAEKAQRFLFEYVQGQVLPKDERLKFGQLYKLHDWSASIGIPKDFKNALVKGVTLDCYYFVAEDGLRYALILGKNMPPVTLVTALLLRQHRPELEQQVVLLPDEFIGRIPLAGSIELMSL